MIDIVVYLAKIFLLTIGEEHCVKLSQLTSRSPIFFLSEINKAISFFYLVITVTILHTTAHCDSWHKNIQLKSHCPKHQCGSIEMVILEIMTILTLLFNTNQLLFFTILILGLPIQSYLDFYGDLSLLHSKMNFFDPLRN